MTDEALNYESDRLLGSDWFAQRIASEILGDLGRLRQQYPDLPLHYTAEESFSMKLENALISMNHAGVMDAESIFRQLTSCIEISPETPHPNPNPMAPVVRQVIVSALTQPKNEWLMERFNNREELQLSYLTYFSSEPYVSDAAPIHKSDVAAWSSWRQMVGNDDETIQLGLHLGEKHQQPLYNFVLEKKLCSNVYQVCRIDDQGNNRLHAIEIYFRVLRKEVHLSRLFAVTTELSGLKAFLVTLEMAESLDVLPWHLPGGVNTERVDIRILLSKSDLQHGPRNQNKVRDIMEQLVVDSEDIIRLQHLKHLSISFEYDASQMAMPGYFIEPLCKLKNLRILKLELCLESLPDCTGDLVQLRYLDLRANRFQSPEALPLTMNKLVNLGQIIGFMQNEQRYNPVEDSREDGYSCRKKTDCKPIYETVTTFDGEPRDDWVCGAMKGHLDEFPMYKLSKMEKFWWDMNNLTVTAAYFDHIVTSFPKLRTLDLYDNDIFIDVKHVKKLKRLTQLHQVQLQSNNIYGIIDPSFFDHWPEKWIRLDLNLNRKLRGCLDLEDIPQSIQWPVFAGTQVVITRGGGYGGLQCMAWRFADALGLLHLL